ncbi:YfgG family protein [Sodalis sp. dw_96]|uniref:YfgG family protein n=1 Tax=Sodalis sp. dw_96 TaxID=2719794 RepID=UPI001BD4DA51|nr:YfgG family protein [Sodalis sp. dw_96]
MKLAYSMHKRRRTSVRMTRWILLISFIILFGRFIFAAIGAWQHQQVKPAEPAEQMVNDGSRPDN